MTPEPIVRVDPQFFADLDAQLGESRGPNGVPSASDFFLIDLPSISRVFAQHFDELPMLYESRDDYRYLVATGLLIRAATITAQRVADGSIVLFGIDIDLMRWPE